MSSFHLHFEACTVFYHSQFAIHLDDFLSTTYICIYRMQTESYLILWIPSALRVTSLRLGNGMEPRPPSSPPPHVNPLSNYMEYERDLYEQYSEINGDIIRSSLSDIGYQLSMDELWLIARLQMSYRLHGWLIVFFEEFVDWWNPSTDRTRTWTWSTKRITPIHAKRSSKCWSQRERQTPNAGQTINYCIQLRCDISNACSHSWQLSTAAASFSSSSNCRLANISKLISLKLNWFVRRWRKYVIIIDVGRNRCLCIYIYFLLLQTRECLSFPWCLSCLVYAMCPPNLNRH